MRLLSVMLGAVAAASVAAAVSADPSTQRMKLAQAQDSGVQSGTSVQSGSGSAASQRGSSGNPEGGGVGTPGSGGGTAGRGTESGNATVRESGGGRDRMRNE